jgi:hypothetical protein
MGLDLTIWLALIAGMQLFAIGYFVLLHRKLYIAMNNIGVILQFQTASQDYLEGLIVRTSGRVK